jgi:transcriptional regulator with XRE-family HTH domain
MQDFGLRPMRTPSVGLGMVDTNLEAIVAARLRAIMQELGLRYDELGDMCGVTRSVISNWVNCYNLPEVREATALCEKTGITLDWLYRGHLGGMDPKLAARLAKWMGA